MPLIHYSASIRDALNQRQSVDAYLSPTDLAGEPAGFEAWLTTLDTIITGVIVAGKLEVTPTLPTALSGTGRSGFADSRVNEQGEVRYNLTGTQKHYTQAVPAIADSAVSSGKLNLTALSAYTGLMTGGAFTDPTGLAAVDSIFGGFLGNRTHRKQLQKGSFTTP